MHRIRTVKTSSGATAVQVVRYVNRKTVVDSHIGSSKNSDDILRLKESAYRWIEQNSQQLSLFSLASCDKNDVAKTSLIPLAKCRNLGFSYQLLYETLANLSNLFKFHLLPNRQIKLLIDLVLTRIVSPSSKLESLKFLKRYFNANHSYRTLSRALPTFIALKDEIEFKVIAIAKKHFGFNFSLVFYDLTTLYFESFETDELRRIGFSKDNKSANPQVMIGLLVNDLGFPISYQLFAGNKFEGHSLTPSILTLKKKHKIKQMTVVADSAMISDDNIKFLKTQKLNYIVAARTANLKIQTIEEIAKNLNGQDEATIRIKTESKGDLILHFSSKRYKKEKAEMEKQLEKAKLILKTPSKAEIIKRTKFLRGKKLGYELNQELIHKANLLLGIKGYYSNCDKLTDHEIISHYKDLWRVEQAFRISKSDLKARPIFHNKQQAIETHILICFMALALAKYIEIKTKKSIKFVINELKEITDAHLYDELNSRKITIRSEIKKDVQEFLDKILSH